MPSTPPPFSGERLRSDQSGEHNLSSIHQTPESGEMSEIEKVRNRLPYNEKKFLEELAARHPEPFARVRERVRQEEVATVARRKLDRPGLPASEVKASIPMGETPEALSASEEKYTALTEKGRYERAKQRLQRPRKIEASEDLRIRGTFGPDKLPTPEETHQERVAFSASAVQRVKELQQQIQNRTWNEEQAWPFILELRDYEFRLEEMKADALEESSSEAGTLRVSEHTAGLAAITTAEKIVKDALQEIELSIKLQGTSAEKRDQEIHKLAFQRGSREISNLIQVRGEIGSILRNNEKREETITDLETRANGLRKSLAGLQNSPDIDLELQPDMKAIYELTAYLLADTNSLIDLLKSAPKEEVAEILDDTDIEVVDASEQMGASSRKPPPPSRRSDRAPDSGPRSSRRNIPKLNKEDEDALLLQSMADLPDEISGVVHEAKPSKFAERIQNAESAIEEIRTSQAAKRLGRRAGTAIKASEGLGERVISDPVENEQAVYTFAINAVRSAHDRILAETTDPELKKVELAAFEKVQTILRRIHDERLKKLQKDTRSLGNKVITDPVENENAVYAYAMDAVRSAHETILANTDDEQIIQLEERAFEHVQSVLARLHTERLSNLREGTELTGNGELTPDEREAVDADADAQSARAELKRLHERRQSAQKNHLTDESTEADMATGVAAEMAKRRAARAAGKKFVEDDAQIELTGSQELSDEEQLAVDRESEMQKHPDDRKTIEIPAQMVTSLAMVARAHQLITSVNKEFKTNPPTFENRERFDDALIELSKIYADLEKRSRELQVLGIRSPEQAEELSTLSTVLMDIQDTRRAIHASFNNLPFSADQPIGRSEREKAAKHTRDTAIESVIEHISQLLIENNHDDPEQYLKWGSGGLTHRFNRLLGRTKNVIDPKKLSELRSKLIQIESNYLQTLYGTPDRASLLTQVRSESPILQINSDMDVFDLWKIARKELEQDQARPEKKQKPPRVMREMDQKDEDSATERTGRSRKSQTKPSSAGRKDPLLTRMMNVVSPNNALEPGDVFGSHIETPSQPPKRKDPLLTRAMNAVTPGRTVEISDLFGDRRERPVHVRPGSTKAVATFRQQLHEDDPTIHLDQTQMIDRAGFGTRLGETVIQQSRAAGLVDAEHIYHQLLDAAAAIGNPELQNDIPRYLQAMGDMTAALKSGQHSQIQKAYMTLQPVHELFETTHAGSPEAERLNQLARQALNLPPQSR